MRPRPLVAPPSVRLSVVAAFVGLIVALVAGAARGSPAGASCPSWQPSTEWTVSILSRGSRQFGPVALAIPPSGATVVAWGPDGEFAQRRAGGRFSRPRATGTSAIVGLQATVIEGRVVIAAQAENAVRLSRISADGRSRRVATVATDRLSPFVLAPGAPGLLAWTTGTGGAVARLDSHGLRHVELLGQAPIAAATSAGAGAGDLLAFEQPSAGGFALGVLERDAGAPWGAPATVPTSGFASAIGAVRSALGGAGLIWQATTGPDTGHFVVESVARRPGGRFGGVQRLSASPVTSPPAVASTPRGRSFAVWAEDRRDISEVMLAEHVPGGDWGPRVRVLFDRRPLHDPLVAVSANGRRLAVVTAIACGTRAALVSRQRIGDRWRFPEIVATWSGYVPRDVRAGIDAHGDLLIAWARRPRAGGGLRRIPIVVARRRALAAHPTRRFIPDPRP
jgi:hypothetical protein